MSRTALTFILSEDMEAATLDHAGSIAELQGASDDCELGSYGDDIVWEHATAICRLKPSPNVCPEAVITVHSARCRRLRWNNIEGSWVGIAVSRSCIIIRASSCERAYLYGLWPMSTRQVVTYRIACAQVWR